MATVILSTFLRIKNKDTLIIQNQKTLPIAVLQYRYAKVIKSTVSKF